MRGDADGDVALRVVDGMTTPPARAVRAAMWDLRGDPRAIAERAGLPRPDVADEEGGVAVLVTPTGFPAPMDEDVDGWASLDDLDCAPTTSAALYGTGQTGLAIAFGATALVSTTLMIVWRQE